MLSELSDGSLRYAFGGPIFQTLVCDSDLCTALARAGAAFSTCGSCTANSVAILSALGVSGVPGTLPAQP